SNPTFENTEQAHAALNLLRDQVIPGYLVFHRDMLFHQSENTLFGPFMLGRVFEAILRQPQPWDEPERIADRVITELNGFLGHRPVPTLETQKIEPRQKEWVCPIPVFIAGAGVCHGPYHELFTLAIELLQETDEDLLREAYFDPELMEELAIDPRSYDFDHPANRRPNYHFGEWDPHRIDNRGNYRRFVVREVNLRALMARVDETGNADLPREELLYEAAAVLAGTILMASGISGSGPDTHDSNTTLLTLITQIAGYRDIFYERLVTRIDDEHGQRLVDEMQRLRQPFGGARQSLNTHLSRQRAAQLERVKLAKVFARMGFVEAAQKQVDSVKVASARMQCRIDCAITAGRQAIRSHDREKAFQQLDRINDVLNRGIECGAVVDPWNIMGFDGNYSLFPALENSVRDHRIDDLVAMMELVFDLYARVWSEAAAMDDQEMAAKVDRRYEETANWWNRFAAHEVTSVGGASALVEYEAARQVAEALNKWHRGGAATGDVRFWAPYVENFDSPKAYALVIETLLNKDDFVSSMSLLIHWLSQAPGVPLELGQISFHASALRWVRSVVRLGFGAHVEGEPAADRKLPVVDAWKLLRRFFDFLEPNAEEYWETPEFGLATRSKKEDATQPEEEESEGDLFRAAYEDVVFQDSTNDGVDGFVFDTGPQTNEELERESERIVDRLAFLDGLAKLWSAASVALGTSNGSLKDEPTVDSLEVWYRRSIHNRERLFELLDEIGHETIPQPAGNHESMVDYDRHRLVKETLMEQIIATIVETSQAERLLLAAVLAQTDDESRWLSSDESDEDEDVSFVMANQAEIARETKQASRLLAAAFRRDREAAADVCDELLDDLPDREILYVPLSKSGSAHAIATVRIRQRTIENLLVALPRMGLLAHTQDLIDTAREMEFNVPAGQGAVTQFDELFDVGFRELVNCLVRTTEGLGEDRDSESTLISCLEQLNESVLQTWLEHSRTLRLSVLERVRRTEAWEELVEFIKQYGDDLFTQRFLGLGNIRAILHCGVDNWLRQIEESGVEPPFRLMEALEGEYSREKAVDHLTLILESIVENFAEYRDYNSTTTQSDHGEMLYMLLDFLRLQSAYDRVAWNLKPVVISHEILVRRRRNEAAQLWRRALTDRVGEEADRYLARLSKLQEKYAMRMASVADRIGEKFLRPMTIDRMRALVQPAIEQLETQPEGESQYSFEILEYETDNLMREPAGSGLDVPQWLVALEDEVERLKPWSPASWELINNDLLMAPYELDLDELQQQLDELRPG
ncbi:MAG: hypothetical protein AAF497_04115, partial [Planctomycetota bacterium]